MYHGIGPCVPEVTNVSHFWTILPIVLQSAKRMNVSRNLTICARSDECITLLDNFANRKVRPAVRRRSPVVPGRPGPVPSRPVAYVHAYVHVRMHMRMHMCTCACICACICACTCARAHAYVHAYVHPAVDSVVKKSIVLVHSRLCSKEIDRFSTQSTPNMYKVMNVSDTSLLSISSLECA